MPPMITRNVRNATTRPTPQLGTAVPMLLPACTTDCVIELAWIMLPVTSDEPIVPMQNSTASQRHLRPSPLRM
jgi:uncharacterized membrane protein